MTSTDAQFDLAKILETLKSQDNRITNLENMLRRKTEPKVVLPSNYIRVKVFAPLLLQERASRGIREAIHYSEIIRIARERGFLLTMRGDKLPESESALGSAVRTVLNQYMKEKPAPRVANGGMGKFIWVGEVTDAMKTKISSIAAAPRADKQLALVNS